MNEILYEMIFKRKSFHLFRNTGNQELSLSDLDDIKLEFKTFKPLVDNIRVDLKYV